jgi:hypothetical protein
VNPKNKNLSHDHRSPPILAMLICMLLTASETLEILRVI